jgi:acetyl-CoA acetyltransferase family protein
MQNAVIVDAIRTPLGKRNGRLKDWHPVDLAGHTLKALVERTGIDPHLIEDVIMGCVMQVGEQSLNVGRNAVLAAGLPETIPGTTIDRQCGSSQQAAHFAAQGVMAGAYDVVIAAGVEVMTRVPMGSAVADGKYGYPFGPMVSARYAPDGGLVPQGISAEMIADKWGISRADTDNWGLTSQQRAIRAWDEDRFSGQYIEVDAPELNEAGEVIGTRRIAKDEGLRETTLEKLATLKPVARENGVHTAGNSSQISDGAAAVLMMTEEKASALGLKPRARIVDSCLVGVDPVLMLTGPIDATQRLLQRNNLKISDIDVFEINEAFASVVLAWAKEVGADLDRTNPNGGAIALGHPLGATGAFLVTKALYELERTGGRYGIISMCCGGGLGTGTLIERL